MAADLSGYPTAVLIDRSNGPPSRRPAMMPAATATAARNSAVTVKA